MAMTLAYLAQEGGFLAVAALFGVAKSTVIVNVNEIMDIMTTVSPHVIHFPSSNADWRQIAQQFEQNCGFPDVAGAIDGTLFEVERPFEYDGWICRKGFAAINMQGTVDAQGRFMEYSLRPGSCSDKNVWRMSSLGSRISSILPRMMHFVGDAGYTLTSSLLTPYLIFDGMPRDEMLFNYLHSKTRIVIERAFGGLKGRWRILKRVLNMKSPVSCGRTIVACIVLHNLTLDAGDDVNLDDRIDPHLHGNIPHNFNNVTVRNNVDREEKRNNIKDYLTMLQ